MKLQLRNLCTRLVRTCCGLSIALTAAGCIPTYRLNAATDSSKTIPSFRLVDQRASAEKQGGSRSRSITNCQYAITDIPDAEIAPPRIDVLRDALQRDAGTALAGRTLVVTSFKIIRNWQASLRSTVLDSKTPLTSAIVSGVSCTGPDPQDGGYTQTENPTSLPSFTIIIAGQLDGRSLHIRHFETAPNLDAMLSKNKENILPAVTERAIAEFASQITR
jgi:hypothetical protein